MARIPPPDHSLDWEHMSPSEIARRTLDMSTRLRAKQRRERAYLARRAARNTHTPTDDAYEADQILEEELLSLLEFLTDCAQQGGT